MTENILPELEARGLIADVTNKDELGAAFAAGNVPHYAGHDPTATSLHIGHLIPIVIQRRLQVAGHRPIALVGGATGMIGDPSGRSTERNLLDRDTLDGNVAAIRAQLARFLDFDESPSGALMTNNADWFAGIGYLEFLRDVGKHVTINYMMAKDSVKSRLEDRESGLSYTEFSYMLLQAWDFVVLQRKHGCRLQVGGSDQWGNIIAGVRLVRQKSGAAVHALTTPLVTDSEGNKFGKSTGGGSLWLDPEMTSPYAWYQYFINTADADVIPYLKWFTFLSADDVADLEQATADRPHERAAQRRLAQELTTLVHGEAQCAAVEHASQALFGRGELSQLDEPTLAAALREASNNQVAELTPGSPDGITDLLVASGLTDSKGAARRTVAEGGAYVNNVRVESDDWAPQRSDFLHDRWLVLRRGKRNIAGVERVG
jgi:tyrosyl-tRNA synthetase